MHQNLEETNRVHNEDTLGVLGWHTKEKTNREYSYTVIAGIETITMNLWLNPEKVN